MSQLGQGASAPQGGTGPGNRLHPDESSSKGLSGTPQEHTGRRPTPLLETPPVRGHCRKLWNKVGLRQKATPGHRNGRAGDGPMTGLWEGARVLGGGVG